MFTAKKKNQFSTKHFAIPFVPSCKKCPRISFRVNVIIFSWLFNYFSLVYQGIFWFVCRMLWINTVGWTFVVLMCVYSGMMIYAEYFECDPLTSLVRLLITFWLPVFNHPLNFQRGLAGNQSRINHENALHFDQAIHLIGRKIILIHNIPVFILNFICDLCKNWYFQRHKVLKLIYFL